MAFSDIIGQDTAISVLRRALQHQRIPHAYLFSGPDGVGKQLTALMLAKALNCRTHDDDACDQCLSCHKIAEGNHPDVRVLEPEGQTIKIDQIRTLQRDVSYKVYEGKRKVYILDHAEALGAEAANALLKTLEEPPSDAVLILLTTNVYALLPTIISRCQLIRFVTLGIEPLTTLIAQKKVVPPEQARLIASLAEGCPGRALGMDMEATLRKRAQIENLLKTLSSGVRDVRVLFSQVEGLLENKAEIQDVFDLMLAWYRDVYVLASQGDPRLIANSDALPRLSATARELTETHIRRLFDIVYQTKLDVQHNANLQLALEIMLIGIAEVYAERNRSTQNSA